MELIKCTNIGLEMSDGTVIPCIKAVLKGPYTNLDVNASNALMYDIYNMSLGFVTAIGWFTSVPADFLTRYGITGTDTFGGNSNFKYVLSKLGSNNSWQGLYCDLYYNNVLYARGQILTGYSRYEVANLVIFTDETNHLLKCSTGNQSWGINHRYSTNPGASETEVVPCGVVSSDGTYCYVQPAFGTFEVLDDISSLIHNEIDPTQTDPYTQGGTTGDDETEGEGGTGDFDDTSTPVTIPPVPQLTAVDAKFITLFNPTLSQLDALASYMWAGLFDVNTFKKLFADPMDCILGLSIVPVAVPDGSQAEVIVGNIGTGIYMTKAATQYVTVDCGTLNVNEYWGAYLDYSPYTKCEIYLPYIGTKPLDIDDIMGKAVHVVYHVDVLSGACIAYVECGGTVLYSFVGQCASQIPVTGNDLSSIIRGALSIGATIGTMVASGGLSAPMAVVGVASTSSTITSAKPQVEKSGSLSGTGGLMGIQTPYLILTRPKQALPENQNTFTGYPSYITRTLSSLSGFTQVEEIHLEGMTCTKDEMIEIEGLLKTGVIL